MKYMKIFVKIIFAFLFFPYAIYLLLGLFIKRKILKILFSAVLSFVFVFMFSTNESITELKEISSYDAYIKFRDDWSIYCKTEQHDYEKWRVANIEPMNKEFKEQVEASGIDMGTNEFKTLNSEHMARIKDKIKNSNEFKVRNACERDFAKSKGYIYSADL